MTRILITGGTGVLGRQLAPRLLERGAAVRVMSRSERRNGTDPQIEWAPAVLATGEGLEQAVRGVDTVIHAASSPFRSQQVDVEGTGKLLKAFRAAQVSHLLYISIVGIEHFPTFPYYRAKLDAERVLESGTVPWTILRATQFHELLDERFTPPLFKLPLIALVPTDFQFQLIDSGEVAERIVELVAAGPGGRAADIGGPEIMDWGQIARKWMGAHGINRRLLRMPLFGKMAAAFRRGDNNCPDQRYGKITFTEYLAKRYKRPSAIRAKEDV